MKRFRAVVESVGIHPTHGETLRLATGAHAGAMAGQPFLALRAGQAEPSRSTLIPFEIHAHGFACTAPPHRNWRAGEELDLLGPVGPGFRPPKASRRWLLLSLDDDPGPLLPLVPLARDRRASVSMWVSTVPSDLPADVEIATDLAAALDWSDYMALCGTQPQLSSLRSLPGMPGALPLIGRRAEILLLSPMPCGFGGCMACAVRVRRGWTLACLDGPVFPLGALSW